jgi:hypothetical protein
MSYIRSTSNPEGLYIWGERDGRVCISIERKLLSIPRHVFRGLLKRWRNADLDAVTQYRGASMRITKDCKFEFRYDGWKKGTKIVAYEVTWAYIANDC